MLPPRFWISMLPLGLLCEALGASLLQFFCKSLQILTAVSTKILYSLSTVGDLMFFFSLTARSWYTWLIMGLSVLFVFNSFAG